MDPFSKNNKAENPASPTTTTPAVPTTPVTPVEPVTPTTISTSSTTDKPATTSISSMSSTTSPSIATPASTATTSIGATTPTTPTISTSGPVQTGHVEKSNKLLYFFIGILLLILIALIGLFFYNRVSNATTAESEIVVPTTIQATPTIVVPSYASEEEKEVMGVEVGGVDSQLNIIEDDANKL